MSWLINLLKLTGFKTYLAGIGMIAYGIYLITEGRIDEGIKSIMEGLAIFGLRAALAKTSNSPELPT